MGSHSGAPDIGGAISTVLFWLAILVLVGITIYLIAL